MAAIEIKEFLIWSLAVNYGILCLWFAAFSLAHERIYSLHSRWFKLSQETFDTIHYSGMAIYKIAVLVLNVAPLVALWVVNG